MVTNTLPVDVEVMGQGVHRFRLGTFAAEENIQVVGLADWDKPVQFIPSIFAYDFTLVKPISATSVDYELSLMDNVWTLTDLTSNTIIYQETDEGIRSQYVERFQLQMTSSGESKYTALCVDSTCDPEDPDPEDPDPEDPDPEDPDPETPEPTPNEPDKPETPVVAKKSPLLIIIIFAIVGIIAVAGVVGTVLFLKNRRIK